MPRMDLTIELHSRACACGGTGWLVTVGVPRRMVECASINVVTLGQKEWVALGRPKNIEEFRKRKT